MAMRLVCASVAILWLQLPGSASADHVIGFGLGGGLSWLSGNFEDTERVAHATVNVMSVATEITSGGSDAAAKIRLGVEVNRWISEDDRMTSYLVAMNAIPFGEGFAFGLGLGFADQFGRTSSGYVDEGAFVALMRLAYELSLNRGFAIAPQFEATFLPSAFFSRQMSSISFGLRGYWFFKSAD